MSQTPAALEGIGMTAFGVAMMRARESRRPDRLFDDPLASRFADFAFAAFNGPCAPADAESTWTTLERLVDAFYDTRVVAIRVFDDFLRDASRHGCTQVVLVGAGLDTRAFRTIWAAPVTVYEVDTPAMHDFKAAVVADSALAVAARIVVRADLREDWAPALLTAGYDPTLPTAWLIEGVLGYLPRADARRLLETATKHSASRSRLAFEYTAPTHAETTQTAGSIMQRARAVPGSQAYFSTEEARGLGDDAREYLASLGWTNAYVDGHAAALSYDRELPDERTFGYLTCELERRQSWAERSSSSIRPSA